MSDWMNWAGPVALLRIAGGAFFIPHIWAKLLFAPPLVEFFEQAGLKPARAFMILTAVIEGLAAAGLIFNLFAPVAALLGAGVLIVATLCLYRVRGFVWIWNGGGFEFPVFWAIVLLVVARLSWV
jgi:putative oxidoreductase